MASRTAARRYAEAIVSLASESDTFEAWNDALSRLTEAFEEPQSRDYLLNPGIPVVEKRASLDRIVGNALPQANNLVNVLLEHRRLALIPDIYTFFTEAWLDRQGIAVAYVTTAEPILPSDERAIREKLQQLTGKQIELRLEIDADIIGGIVARVGDTLLDGSVRTKLRALRLRLASIPA